MHVCYSCSAREHDKCMTSVIIKVTLFGLLQSGDKPVVDNDKNNSTNKEEEEEEIEEAIEVEESSEEEKQDKV